jgi:hypothetical protein
MESVPGELWEFVILFLSLKEKINVRKVSSFFRSYINRYYLIQYRLHNNLIRSFSIERKMENELILTINNNFIFYTDYQKPRVHSLFRINNHQYERCVNVNCREKRLGNIYFSKKKHNLQWNLYTRRMTPYCFNCFNCFNTWGPLMHHQTS